MPDSTLFPPREQAPFTTPPYHEWPTTVGGYHPIFYRQNNGYLIRFNALVDFAITADATQVNIHPVPGIADCTVEEIYRNLIVPLALGHQQKLVFHASAIEIDDFSVIFVAASGYGKSTLATSFLSHGYRFLAEDGVLLKQQQSGYVVAPGYPSLRLWKDSWDALDVSDNALDSSLTSTGKVQLRAISEDLHCRSSRNLRHVYILGDGITDHVSIDPMSDLDAVANLLRHRFLLDVAHKTVLTRNIRDVSRLARHTTFYQLDYPRSFDVLDEVVGQVTEHSRSRLR